MLLMSRAPVGGNQFWITTRSAATPGHPCDGVPASCTHAGIVPDIAAAGHEYL